jgi:two-component system, NarL family, response regulator YdfI
VIRLLIAAPSPVVRAGLEALVASSPGITIVGAYPDMAAADDFQPDVVLAHLPIEELTPSPAIVLLTGEGPAAWTPGLLRAGVRALLSPHAAPAEILAAIESAAAGLVVMDPHDLEPLLAAGSRTHAGTPQALTPRELEVLRMLAEGAANKTIAWKLAISEHTVKFHVAAIMAKLNAASRTEAVTIGIRQGLILI